MTNDIEELLELLLYARELVRCLAALLGSYCRVLRSADVNANNMVRSTQAAEGDTVAAYDAAQQLVLPLHTFHVACEVVAVYSCLRCGRKAGSAHRQEGWGASTATASLAVRHGAQLLLAELCERKGNLVRERN